MYIVIVYYTWHKGEQKEGRSLLPMSSPSSPEFLSLGPKNGLDSGDFQLGLPECLARILVVYNSQFSLGLATP